MAEDTIMRQVRRRIIVTSIFIIIPYFVSVFFWSYIPCEIGILVGTSSPYVPKLVAFTVLPIVFIVANVFCILLLKEKYYKKLDGITVVLPLATHSADTLLEKIYFLFRRAIYWAVPIAAWIGAICNYIVAFRGPL